MSNQIVITGRLSFPHLFTASAFQPGQEPKFDCTVIMENDHACVARLRKAIDGVIKEKWPKGAPASLKVGLRDGAEKDLDGYGAGRCFLSAKSKTRPTIIDRDKTPLAEEDGKLYPGCWVNAIVTPWAQDNNYGKRVNFNLLLVQFVKDDEPFGDSVQADTSLLPDLEPEDAASLLD
ncbi:MAG: ssDNA-binding protein [Ilumatobacteraceae bacterium]